MFYLRSRMLRKAKGEKMKKLLVILLVVALLFSVTACTGTKKSAAEETSTEVVAASGGVEDAATAYFADFPGNRIVTWDDLFAKMDAGDEPFILSIRQQDVYDEGHIKGAALAAWGTDLAEKVAMLPTDEPVYVYCYSGQTAGQAVALMNMLGIEAYSVKSGYNYGAMKTEGYEAYVDKAAVELADAGAKFDKKVLEYVQGYFNAIPDSGNNIISSTDAKPLIDAGDVVVVDIRKSEDYDAAHIEGAVSIPWGGGMQENFANLPADKKIVVTCYSGQTAGQTVAVMRSLGYDAVSLKFGMNGKTGWVNTTKADAANAYFADFPGNRIIKWEDVFAKMDAGEEPFILSIRKKEDYDEGHIKGATLAAWGTDLAEKVSMLPTDKPVYVYCYSGQTAGQAVALMNMLGIEAHSIKSGFVKGAMTIDGYEAYVDTTAVELADAGAEFDAVMLKEVEAYFAAIPEEGSNIIALADAKAEIEAGEVSVIDIRQAEDFAAGHIEGSVNIPWGAGMQESFTDLPEGKLVVTCYSGQTAGQTVAVLRMLGEDAVSLKYGMKVGWVPEGYPVVTE